MTELVTDSRGEGARTLRVVDVGTGTGQVALLLAEMGHDVTGYDIAAGMLGRARAKAEAAGLPVSFALADAYDLPVEDASVDVVVNRMVFWTLYDPVRALVEWRRVVAPGGRIVVIDGLWRATPTGLPQKARTACAKAFWVCANRLRQRHGPKVGRYDTDAVQPAGLSWQTVADAQAHFTQAGLHGSRAYWLDALYGVQRRTTPYWRWFVDGHRLFALTWQRPVEPRNV